VDKVKETCVDLSDGNRDAAPPKGDTAYKCLLNNRNFVLHSFIQRLMIGTSTMEKYQFVIVYYFFLAMIKCWAPDMFYFDRQYHNYFFYNKIRLDENVKCRILLHLN